MSEKRKPDGSYMCDHDGNPSSIRLNSAICLAMACFITIVDVLGYAAGTAELMELIVIFLAFGFAPKLGQAVIERWVASKLPAKAGAHE